MKIVKPYWTWSRNRSSKENEIIFFFSSIISVQESFCSHVSLQEAHFEAGVSVEDEKKTTHGAEDKDESTEYKISDE